jgi:uncharacterized membrane protein YeaQ/YmgE (transglycosylase-associated protein family)
MKGTSEVVPVGWNLLTLNVADFPLLTIFAVLLICGVIGGLAGYFFSGRKEYGRTWYGSLLIGVVAAFITPLLLSMMSSDLLTAWESKPHLLFVLAGFALLAAVFGERFLANMYEKLMKQVWELRARVEDVEEANEPSPPELEDRTGPPAAKLAAENIDSAQYRIMEAMASSKYESRSFSGLRRSTGLKASEVNQQLTELIARGFVSQRQSKRGEVRWFLTGTGREALAKLKA